MAGLKPFLFVFVLVAAMTAAPLAEAQLGGLGSLLGLNRIQGTVFCSINGSAGANGAATPVFPNALVQLKCGSSGNVASSTTTNSAGGFTMLLDPIITLLLNLLSNCTVVVNTPLSTCNVELPTNNLVSTLKLFGTTASGVLNIFNLIPTGFNMA
ncbi:phylloplanin-like [Papaver somniferum]|nr:phylloplanin-like [Papaver somniferum]